MSLTYTDERTHPADPYDPALREAPFVPVYARPRGVGARKGGVKTWMILAPVGVLAVAGVVAAMSLSGGGETSSGAPVLQPASTAPVLPATGPALAPVDATPVEAAPITRAPAPVAPTPAAPVRRAAPATVRETAPAPTVREVPAPTPAPTPAPAATLKAAPAPSPSATTEPPPPAIVVQPLD